MRGKKEISCYILSYTCIHLTARENMVLSCRLYMIFTLMILLLMFYRSEKTIPIPSRLCIAACTTKDNDCGRSVFFITEKIVISLVFLVIGVL